MTYYVAVENISALRYAATIVGWPNCMAEGDTRDEAIARVKKQFAERLNQVEIVPIEIESSAPKITAKESVHPWGEFAGMHLENPLFDDVLSAIQQSRHEMDEDETVL